MNARTREIVQILYDHMSLRTRPLSQLVEPAVLVVPSRARQTTAYARAVRTLTEHLRPQRILVVGGQTSLIAPVLEAKSEDGKESEIAGRVLTLKHDTPGTTATNVRDVVQICRVYGITENHVVVTQSGTAMRRVLRTFQTLWSQCATGEILNNRVIFDSTPVDIFKPRSGPPNPDGLLFLHELCEEVHFLSSFSEVGALDLEDGDLNDRVLSAAAELKAYLASVDGS